MLRSIVTKLRAGWCRLVHCNEATITAKPCRSFDACRFAGNRMVSVIEYHIWKHWLTNTGKRTSKLVDQNNQPVLKDFNFGYDGLSHIADNSFNRYSLQQNIYKCIIEEHYKKKISSMNLLVLHPNYNDFIHLKLPDMKKEAEFLINQAKELTN